MKKRVIAIGPGAASLILIVVALSMSVLGMLTLMSARNDRKLAERSADMAQNIASLNERAEQSVAALDAVLFSCEQRSAGDAEYQNLISAELPEGMTLEDGEIFWMEQEGDHVLDCSVKLAPWGESPRCRWSCHGLMMQTEEMNGLWN